MLQNEYDEIADKYYQDSMKRPERECIFIPTIRHYMQNLAGKRILDAGCGH